jgi:hypothetical protein
MPPRAATEADEAIRAAAVEFGTDIRKADRCTEIGSRVGGTVESLPNVGYIRRSIEEGVSAAFAGIWVKAAPG